MSMETEVDWTDAWVKTRRRYIRIRAAFYYARVIAGKNHEDAKNVLDNLMRYGIKTKGTEKCLGTNERDYIVRTIRKRENKKSFIFPFFIPRCEFCAIILKTTHACDFCEFGNLEGICGIADSTWKNLAYLTWDLIKEFDKYVFNSATFSSIITVIDKIISTCDQQIFILERET